VNALNGGHGLVDREQYLNQLDDAILRAQAEHRTTLLALREAQHVFSHFVPRDFLRLLGSDIMSVRLGDHVEMKTTILFADIRNFTSLSENQRPEDVFRTLNEYLGSFEAPIHSHGGVIDKFIGDAIMAIFRSADDAVSAAIAMQERVQTFNRDRIAKGLKPIKMGIGVNTGYSSLGVIGNADRMETTVIGDAVNVAARIQDLTKKYSSQLLISESTHVNLEDCTQYTLRFIDRVKVKGRVRPVSIYEVFDTDPEELKAAKVIGLDLFERAAANYHLGYYGDASASFEKYSTLVPEDPVAEVYRAICNGLDESGDDVDRDREFAWSAIYDTNHPEIDGHHHELASIYEQLKAAVRSKSVSEIENILKSLTSYSKFHFAAEAKLMKESNYPLAEEHLNEHRSFVRRLNQFGQKLRDSRSDERTILFGINLFLFDWLASHSTTVDHHLVQYLSQKPS